MISSRILASVLLVSCLALFAQAQTPAGRLIQTEVEKSDLRVSQIIAKAEEHFRNAQLLLTEGKREKARDEFDKAVDAIIESGMDVRASNRFQAFYLDLIERIYKLELPTPNPASLPVQSSNQASEPKIGFKEQKVEPSPLDELSRLILYPSEITHSTSVCTADQVNSLEVRGLRLGMSVEQVKTQLPSLQFTPATAFGHTSASLFVSKQGKIRPKSLKGVDYISLHFLDGRLTEVRFLYDASIKWESAAQFAQRISVALGLPRGWAPYHADEWYRIGRLQVLRCENIRFLAGLALIGYRERPVLYWSDLNADGIAAQRKQEAIDKLKRQEEERRRAFKP